MNRLVISAVLRDSGTLKLSRRHSIFEHKTKGSSYMIHLDIYARRDPQLAPYLLQEIDIEYKRKCRKVNFLIWLLTFTLVVAFQTRLQGETLHYMQLYASRIKAEHISRDEDYTQRLKVFLCLMNTIKDSFDRDQKWTKADESKALKCFEK
ncbi:unnamed protein product [Phytomonas sp. Hart1]|nr:unnamed protein product [Phytomonas sp. Hart1]|eukprot:CCW70452.1 unnamed protein product [Phytomonas sp. isolate Hart1]